jgi:hypothetical protein
MARVRKIAVTVTDHMGKKTPMDVWYFVDKNGNTIIIKMKDRVDDGS